MLQTWTATFRQLSAILLMCCVGASALLADDAGSGASVTLHKVPPLDDTQSNPPPPSSHPLLPALKIAYRSYDFLTENVKDYSCRVAKRERIDGRLRPYEFLDAKVRHTWRSGGRLVHPRGVYLKYVHPPTMKNREVLWVEGRNDGDLIVRRGGRRFHYITVTISPDSASVRSESRYSPTEMGMKTMVRRLIEIGLADLKHGECDVQFFEDVKVDGRPCTCIQVIHPYRREHFKYHLARIFVDDQFPLPIRFEAYDWPAEEGGEPVLLEQYTFQNLKLNVGFRDAEFRRDYSGYGFRN